MSNGYWGMPGGDDGWFNGGKKLPQQTTIEIMNNTLDKISLLSQELLAELANPNPALPNVKFQEIRRTSTQARAALAKLIEELDRLGA